MIGKKLWPHTVASKKLTNLSSGEDDHLSLEHLDEVPGFAALDDPDLNGLAVQLVVQPHRVQRSRGLFVLAGLTTL